MSFYKLEKNHIIYNMIRYTPGGNGAYALALLGELASQEKIKIILIINSEYLKHESFIRIKGKINDIYIFDDKKNILLEGFFIRKILKYYKNYLFFSPTTLLPLFHNKKIKSIITIHDFSFLFLKMNFLKRHYKKLLYKYSIKNSTGIICVSNFTKNELIKIYPKYADKTEVIWHGHSWDKADFKNQKPRVSKIFTFAHWPHKNTIQALRIINELKSRGYFLELYIIGNNSEYNAIILEEAKEMNLVNQVYFLGKVSNQELLNMYKSFLALIFMSEYEGFGMPVLEAAAVGCPVITSNHSGMLEVATDIIKTFNSNDVENPVNYIIMLLTKKNYINNESEKIMDFYKNYTWELTSKKSLDFIRGL